MLIGMVILAFVFIFLGWGIQREKWYFLISGYNSMSKEEQAQIDVEGLGKAIGAMCYFLAVALVALGLFVHFNLWELLWFVTVLIIVIPILFVFYTRRFYPNGMSSTISGTKPKTKKVSVMITSITLISVAILLYFAWQPTNFKVTPDYFDVSGVYGDQMAWNEIDELTLIEDLPVIGARTNGSAVGSKLKGNFKLKNGEQVKLFLEKQVKQYITYTWKGKKYFINLPSKEKTKGLYEEMLNAWSESK